MRWIRVIQCLSAILAFFVSTAESKSRPNIVFIVADDLGWNDVGFHGSNQIPTPNIDALAYGGIILNNYYVEPVCTPSRSAIMTGKYPIHTGMQHRVIYAAEPRGLPLKEKLLSQYLKELGYVTRIVGKWHLGSYKKEYTPLHRGFDSHLGYWTGHQDYNDHTAVEWEYWGLDMRRDMKPAWDLHGKYSTDVFTDESVRLIKDHNSSRPLFLYLAHAAVHSANPYNPLPAPDETVAKYGYIQDYKRRRYAAMLHKLDESVGRVVEALNHAKMLDNSIIVFTTDNGGAAAGFNLNAASNWPLRGVKNTLWEGGIRGVGLIWSPLLKKNRRVSNQLMHITDWMPTLYSAVGGRTKDLGNIDGIDLWKSLSDDLVSTRTEVLHNIDDIYGNAALTVGHWKIVKGTTYNGAWDGWFGPAGRDSKKYNVTQVQHSRAGVALQAIGHPVPVDVKHIRAQAEVHCSSKTDGAACKPLKATCLFDIKEDPCEQNNLAAKFPVVLKRLEDTLTNYNKTAVEPNNKPKDPKGDPKLWDHTWTTFGDDCFEGNDVFPTEKS